MSVPINGPLSEDGQHYALTLLEALLDRLGEHMQPGDAELIDEASKFLCEFTATKVWSIA